jgi:sigma-E factor negative regulatory protein RseC
MMQTRGRVETIADGIAAVRVEAISACGSCRSKAGCATGAAASSTRLVQVDATAAMHTGDEITLQMESGTVAGGALFGYLMPALAVLLGAIAGSVLYGSDSAAALGAGAGLVIAIIALRLGSRLLFRRTVRPSVCHPAHDSFSGDSA